MKMIPVTVLTGFLGSGKTTLLSHLLRHPEMGRTAVIINEFGEMGLDHELVETSEEDFVELTTGCLCCRLRDDLVLTLHDLLARRRREEVTAFNQIVIETTGLADPAPILQTLASDVALAETLKLANVVTTVDALLGLETLTRFSESARQVAVADKLVLTKTDLVDDDGQRLLSNVRKLNPWAPLHSAVNGRIEPSLLMGSTQERVDPLRWLGQGVFDGVQPKSAQQNGNDSGPGRHGSAIETFSIVRNRPLCAVTLTLLLQALSEHCGANLLRLKGIVKIEEDPEHPAVIHGVQHVFHPPTWLDHWPSSDRRSRLVFIAKTIQPTWVNALIETLDAEVRQLNNSQPNKGAIGR